MNCIWLANHGTGAPRHLSHVGRFEHSELSCKINTYKLNFIHSQIKSRLKLIFIHETFLNAKYYCIVFSRGVNPAVLIFHVDRAHFDLDVCYHAFLVFYGIQTPWSLSRNLWTNILHAKCEILL